MLRSKHGRDRIITDPDALWESACEYFKWCEDHPIITIDYKGKDATLVEYPKPIPFQKERIALFCGVSKWESIDQLKSVSNDFLEVITRIEGIIMTQKFEGASCGLFNPLIIARDLGLSDNQKHEMSGSTEVVISDKQSKL